MWNRNIELNSQAMAQMTNQVQVHDDPGKYCWTQNILGGVIHRGLENTYSSVRNLTEIYITRS